MGLEIFPPDGRYRVFHPQRVERRAHRVCKTAVLYDEQPTSFRQSWNQRLRWAKGFLQVVGKYGARRVKSIVSRRSFASYDMTMTIMPAMLLTLCGVLSTFVAVFVGVALGADVSQAVRSLVLTAVNAYLLLFAIGLITCISEWKMIHCRAASKIRYLFSFPLFLFTYIPIAFVALFKKVDWKPIRHSEVKTLAEVRGNVKIAS
jgi:cellulose synthase/poly-beta-1,6-N-acetylglucosamine synthase-like glycosyltransferase